MSCCRFFILAAIMLASQLVHVNAQESWQKDPDNPVVPFWGGGVDDPSGYKYAYSPSVLYDSSRHLYRMWFASVAFGYGTSFSISYANSVDGVNWNAYMKNPVLLVGPSGSFEERGVFCPRVVRDGNLYRMYYTGFRQNGRGAIGLATSSDGLKWLKYSGNPILDAGAGWDNAGVSIPHVFRQGGGHSMLYVGSNDGTHPAIGMATSSDGIVWSKHPLNPVLTAGAPGSWDQNGAYIAALVVRGGTYFLFYTGGYYAPTGYATSSNALQWTKYQGNPVFQPGPSGSWDERAEIGSMVLKDSVIHYWYSGNQYSMPGAGWQIGHAVSRFQPTSVSESGAGLQEDFVLAQNYPNPFNPVTTFSFEIPHASIATLRVYDMLGREVATVVNEELKPGKHKRTFEASGLASGVYFYRLQAAGYVEAKKLVLVR